MSSKLRVYEVARDLGMDNKELVTLLQSIGFSEIKNHMSVVPSEAIDRAKRQLERKNEPNKVVEERIRPTVVKRRTAAKRPEEGAGAESAPAIAVAVPHGRDETRRDEVRPTAASTHVTPGHAPAAPSPAVDPAKSHGVSTTKVETQHEKHHGDGATSPAQPAQEVHAKASPVVSPDAPEKAESAKKVEHFEQVLEESNKHVAEAPEQPKTEAPVIKASHGETTKPEAVHAEPQKLVAQPVAQASVTQQPDVVQSKESEPSKAVFAINPEKNTVGEVKPVPAASVQAAVAAEESAKPSSTEAVVAPVPRVETPASADVGKVVAEKAVAPKGETAKVEESKPKVASATSAAQKQPNQGAVPSQANVQASHGTRSTPPGPRVVASPAPGARPSTPPGPSQPSRPSSPPRTGIEVWEGRPGVPMSPAHRAPVPRRVQYDAKAGANAAQRRPGQPAQRVARGTRGKGPMGGGGGYAGPAGNAGRGGPMGGRGSNAPPATQERGAHKRVVKIEGSVGLQTLANSMGVKAHELLRKLIMLGMTGVNINSTLDADTAKIVATEFGWDVADVAVSEEQALVIAQGVETEADTGEREPRPPVVTVMGHVDHGKTSLLDRIRKANVVAGEAGGITQHIGAYSVELPRGRITFLDTPGHAAFTAMRMRGAQTTDIVILVVASDDGVMPQTKEAVNHAKAAKVPIVVAINKCDKPEAQPDRCRRELAELGLVPEEWGGDTLFTEVSAHTGKGIDELLERVLLQAEMLDLRANPNKLASGVVIEAQLDRGRGPVATMLITDGTLKRGDILLVGAACGKVRAMLDSAGRSLAEAGPATPVEVIGLDSVPAAGDPVHVIKDLKTAQELADSRKIKERRSLMPSGGQRLTLEELYKAMKETEQLELKVIVKADVHGSVEAVSDALMRLSTEKVKVTVVHAAAGAITEGDVNLAVAAGAIIIGFNVRPAGKAAALASQEKVEVRQYNIIYNVVDDVKAAMEGLLSPSLIEKVLGQAQVRQVFRVSKAGNVAGCMVTQGVIRRAAGIRVMREEAMIWSGKMSALKRFKDDAREVKEGFDCGISLDGYQDIKEGDILECFEMEEVRQTL
jgi:translation initiation factor IF-2